MDLGSIAGIAGAAYLGGVPAASAAAAYFGGQERNQANIDIANANNQWSAQQYATRYQTQVKDLEAAGLNPMLAYMQSPGSAPTAQPVVVGNSAGEAAQAYNESYSSRARASHDIASAGVAEKMQGQIEATTSKIRSEIDQIKGDTNFEVQQDKLKQTAKMLQFLGDKYQEEGMSQGKLRELHTQTIKNLVKSGDLMQLDIDAAKKFDNFGREYKQYAPIVELMKAILLPRGGGIIINK